MNAARIETVIMDLAGTTVVDDGIVVAAFGRAWDRLQPSGEGVADRIAAVQWVLDTMGQSKISVFRHLMPEDAAQQLNVAFETALDELVAEGSVAAIPGAEETIRALRADGRRVALTTGFARPTVDAILAALGWQDLADVVLTPGDVGRGRPAPDLNLAALMSTEASGVDAIAVIGDTPSDARSGVAAGAGLIVGVRTGASSDVDLRDGGSHEILDSVADLPDLLRRLAR